MYLLKAISKLGWYLLVAKKKFYWVQKNANAISCYAMIKKVIKNHVKTQIVCLTVLPDRKQVLEFGSSSRNHSTPACILTDAIPSCFRTITNSSLTIIFFFEKKLWVKKIEKNWNSWYSGASRGRWGLVLAKI